MSRAVALLRRLAGDDVAARAEARASRLSSSDLVDWAEAAVPGIGRALEDWTRKGLPDGLEEALSATASLMVVLEQLELRRRRGIL